MTAPEILAWIETGGIVTLAVFVWVKVTAIEKMIETGTQEHRDFREDIRQMRADHNALMRQLIAGNPSQSQAAPAPLAGKSSKAAKP